MEAVGFPHDNGPIAVMLHDHDSGRAFVRAMAGVVEGAARGDTDALRTFANNAHGYTDMLREHIQKEDRILYPMADQSFDESDQAELLAAFEKADNQAGAGIHERYLELARTLASQYGISEGDRPRYGSQLASEDSAWPVRVSAGAAGSFGHTCDPAKIADHAGSPTSRATGVVNAP